MSNILPVQNNGSKMWTGVSELLNMLHLRPKLSRLVSVFGLSEKLTQNVK